MASWWLIVLLSSQVIFQQTPVEATFDIGLGWLRGESSLFGFLNTTATAATTETTIPLTTPLGAVTTDHVLLERHTDDITGNAVTATTTSAATTVTAEQTTITETDAGIAGTTNYAVPYATPVSLDDLALHIGKVPDPVLHVVSNRDGSQSFVVISGREGPTDITTPTSTSTTEATTATATRASVAEPTTPTVAGTTNPAAPNTTSPYLTLLHYLRPFIFGRLGAASTAGSTEATTAVPSTRPPRLTDVPDSNPATTDTTNPGLSSVHTPATTTPSTVVTTTATEPTALTTISRRLSQTTAVPDADLATYPAEFRATEPPESLTTQDALGYGNASSTQTLATEGKPSNGATAFDTTISTTPVVSTTATATPASTLPNFYISTTVSPDTTTAKTITTDAITSDPNTLPPETTTASTTATDAITRDANRTPAPRFLATSVGSEHTTVHTTSVTTVTSQVAQDSDAPNVRSVTNGTTDDVSATLDNAPSTTVGDTSTRTNAPGQLGSLVSQLIEEVTQPTIGDLREVTFAPWPPTAVLKSNSGNGADEPKYRYFYDPTQVMQVL